MNSVVAGLLDSPTVDANAEDSSVDGDETEETAEMVAVAAPEAGTKVLTVPYDSELDVRSLAMVWSRMSIADGSSPARSHCATRSIAVFSSSTCSERNH